MQKSIEQKEDWEEIWKRHGVLDRVIDWGRTTYNYFLKRILRRYLNAQSDMLELGCGRASLSLALSPEIHSLVGVDISDVAVEQATEYAKVYGMSNATFTLDDCTKLALPQKFDFVWSQGLLEHFEDSNVVAQEHFRALKPGGTALLSVPYTYSYFVLWYKVTRPACMRRFWPWTEQRFFNHNELLAVGRAITPNARVFLLQPFPLGIIFLEMKKDA